jgi:hypothetical protein
MFFAETIKHCFTSEHTKQSCLNDCSRLLRHQRIQWGHNADITKAGSLNFYSGRSYPLAGATPLSPKCVLYYCQRVATQLQLTNISYHIISHFNPQWTPVRAIIKAGCVWKRESAGTNALLLYVDI